MIIIYIIINLKRFKKLHKQSNNWAIINNPLENNEGYYYNYYYNYCKI